MRRQKEFPKLDAHVHGEATSTAEREERRSSVLGLLVFVFFLLLVLGEATSTAEREELVLSACGVSFLGVLVFFFATELVFRFLSLLGICELAGDELELGAGNLD